MTDTLDFNADGDFLVEMRGEALAGIGIHPGDQLIIRQHDTADDGQLVLATVRGEALIRRITRDGETVTLTPEHKAIEPVTAPATDVHILGLVVGVVRSVK